MAIVVPMLLMMLSSMMIPVALYVLTALGLYTMAKSRGISNPWLAWIPVAGLWIVGSLSDQYRYVTRGEVKYKRFILVALGVVAIVLGSVVGGLGTRVASVISKGMMNHVSAPMFSDIFVRTGTVFLLWFLPSVALAIVRKVVEYMALYDIYNSCDPENSALYLVFSILFGVTQPFFLFFNRKNEKGMPPRLNTETFTQEPMWEL